MNRVDSNTDGSAGSGEARITASLTDRSNLAAVPLNPLAHSLFQNFLITRNNYILG